MKIPRLTGPPLPHYDPDFRPNWVWKARTGRALLLFRKTALFFIPRAKTRIVCGSTGVGKSTLIYNGLHELAVAGVYSPDDLVQLSEPEPNETTKRFTIKRSGMCGSVDSWLDIMGEKFARAFAPGGRAANENASLEHFLRQVNAIVMVFAAEQLLEVYRRRKKPSRIDIKLINGFISRINDLHPTLKRRFGRKGFEWHLVVNQCGDVLDSSKNRHSELVDAIRYFSDKTAFGRVCRFAILCDCDPESAESRGVKVEPISVGKRGRLSVSSTRSMKVCSAGVALALILGRLRYKKKKSDFNFVIPFNKSNNEPST